MACEHLTLPGGGRAIICGRRQPREKCGCGRNATLLCDWRLARDDRVPGKKSVTCDKPLCERCTTSPAPGKDLCPGHARALGEWRSKRAGGAS